MNLLKRAVAWIVRIIAIAVAVIGLILLLLGLLDGQSENVTPGIIMIVVGIIVSIVALRMGRKAKVENGHKKLQACKHCGGSFNDRYTFEYNLIDLKKVPLSGKYKIPVDIVLTCSNCGREMTLRETVQIPGNGNADDDIRDQIEKLIDDYVKG